MSHAAREMASIVVAQAVASTRVTSRPGDVPPPDRDPGEIALEGAPAPRPVPEKWWSGPNLVGRYHAWRSDTAYPVPGTAVAEEMQREAMHPSVDNIARDLVAVAAAEAAAAAVEAAGVLAHDAAARAEAFEALTGAVEAVVAAKAAVAAEYDAELARERESEPDLLRSIKVGDFAAVQSLFARRAVNINAAEPVMLNTPLILAVRAGRVRFVRLFLASGASPNMENLVGLTAFHYAWEQWRRVPRTSLLKAVRTYQVEQVAAMLLEAGADPNARGATRQTPLHLAGMHGHTRVAMMMLEKGGDAHAGDKYGKSPLAYAEAAGHRETASVLRNWGLIASHKKEFEFRARWKRFLDSGGDLDDTSVVGSAASVLERLALEERMRLQEYTPHVHVVASEVPPPVLEALAAASGPLAPAPPPRAKPRKFVALPVRVVPLSEEQLRARLEHAEEKARVRRKHGRADTWARVAHGLPDALGARQLARTMLPGGDAAAAEAEGAGAPAAGGGVGGGGGGGGGGVIAVGGAERTTTGDSAGSDGGGAGDGAGAAPLSELARRRRVAARLIANDVRASRVQADLDGVTFVKTPAMRSAVLRPSRARVAPLVRPAPDAARDAPGAAPSAIELATAAADARAARVGVSAGVASPPSRMLPPSVPPASVKKSRVLTAPLEDPWAYA